MGLMISGLRSYNRTTTDINLDQPNAQAVRRITETLRGAMNVTITNSGRTITYTLPAMSTTNDPVTGEREVLLPLVSDGVTRTFTISTAGVLTSNPGGRVLVRDISLTDPDTSSSTYNQSYAPFQLSPIGGGKAISITLITAATTNGQRRYTRMKTTALLRNYQ
jgi:hypothetical protein